MNKIMLIIASTMLVLFVSAGVYAADRYSWSMEDKSFFIDKDVVTHDGEKLGKVKDFTRHDDGNLSLAIVDREEGMGEEMVAIPSSLMIFDETEDHFVADVTEAELAAAPLVTSTSEIMFDTDKSLLKDTYKGELDQLAGILKKYEDTNILIQGHTDSTGSDEYNLDLSRKRAEAVADYLAMQDVLPSRFTITGLGESQPVAGNDTVSGRAQNRRVEVALNDGDFLHDRAYAEDVYRHYGVGPYFAGTDDRPEDMTPGPYFAGADGRYDWPEDMTPYPDIRSSYGRNDVYARFQPEGTTESGYDYY
jgi:outer membrane protein OmpA-like peptidoglycan-associated protein